MAITNWWPVVERSKRMTLIELKQFVGSQGHVKLSWSRMEGWSLHVVLSDGAAWATKTQDDDLEALFDRCAQALTSRSESEEGFEE